MKILHHKQIPNSYKLKSIAEILILPENKDDLYHIFKNFTEKKIVVLGRGNNIILSKEYYNDSYAFVILNDNFSNYSIYKNKITALAGIDMKYLSMIAMCHSLSGLEHFFGLPSSLGGAVYMNAGAYDFETSQITEKIIFFDIEKKEFKEFKGEECKFAYRTSIFQNLNGIIAEVTLQLKHSNKKEIYARMIDLYNKRLEKQPLDFPSAGSVFKRPKGYYVGKIIEELGLKGLSYGGAKISEKHAGFIINYNNATSKDILTLIDIVRQKVKEKYGIWLEVEQVII